MNEDRPVGRPAGAVLAILFALAILIFFDVKAAFPSVSQEFMMLLLDWLGLPLGLVLPIRMSYLLNGGYDG